MDFVHLDQSWGGLGFRDGLKRNGRKSTVFNPLHNSVSFLDPESSLREDLEVLCVGLLSWKARVGHGPVESQRS